MSKSYLVGVAGAALAFAFSPMAFAQTAEDEAIVTSEELVVTGEIVYRNRTEQTAPTLEYGLDYFQRFEPLTVGDALKRVPSVAFLSDVLESDGVRLRGLDPAYTQILINGEKVAGSGADSGAFGNGSDTAFFVDRIPAELIERVEIVRSASANRSGDALAGAINIVLRDGYALDGGFVRVGALHWAGDGEWGQTIGGAYGAALGEGRILLGANLQDRHNPKDKFSQRFVTKGGALRDVEDQTDVRDGTDYSVNFAFDHPAPGGEIAINGFYVRTDRLENEDSTEFLNPTGGALRADANLFTVNDNNVDIFQESFALNGEYEFELFGGETEVKLGVSRFAGTEDEFENEMEYLRDAVPFPEADRFTRDLIRQDVTDQETSFKIEHERDLGGDAEVEFGVHYVKKERDSFYNETRQRTNIAAGTLRRDASEAGIALPAPSLRGNAETTIKRTSLDPFVLVMGEGERLAWEAGVRYEATELEIFERVLNGAVLGRTRDKEYGTILPSAHLKFDLTDDLRVTASAARTIRNPSFTFLNPALLAAELGDNDFQGNPNLKPEKAWGADLGVERRIGKTGVAGVNVFYRDVQDLIELTAIQSAPGVPQQGSGGAGTFVYTAGNTGDGTVYGVEFDFSASLSFIGLENTGVFANYSWLDSDVDDLFGSRRFQSQSDFIFNGGFIQDLPALGAAFGVTYRKQGDAFSRVVGEEVTTEYGADLEAFLEKRFGERFTLRLTGSNLLDASKDEVFDKFGTVAEQRGRIYDEYELETESAGPVYQLIGRWAF